MQVTRLARPRRWTRKTDSDPPEWPPDGMTCCNTAIRDPSCQTERLELVAESSSDTFGTYILPNTRLKRLATGFDWTEGPVWFGDMNVLLFSDIPADRIMCWCGDGCLVVFRQPSRFSNGLARDTSGRLLACEHGARRVTRTEHDGSITVLADCYRGRKLNSPNDVVTGPDGSIWFTDPHYGIVTDHEGHRAEEELPCSLYRVDRNGNQPELMSDELACPNGLAFSPDGGVLYVSDTGRLHDRNADPCIYRFPVVDCGSLGKPRQFFKVDCGVSDGFCIDSDGNLWSSAGDGVHCISPGGELLGRIRIPETVSNVTFGDRAGHVLFITATTSVYAVPLNRRAAGW